MKPAHAAPVLNPLSSWQAGLAPAPHAASITPAALVSALAMHAIVRGSLAGGVQLPGAIWPVVHVGHERA
jgi:hypothetical protein